jgi:iron complex transport system substrate-binding protein
VVSLLPSATDLVVALGAGDRLVARTEYDTDPSLARLPSVGRGLTPNWEALTALRPDLVIVWPDNESPPELGELARLGVRVYTPHTESLADVVRTARELGRLLGRESAAESLVSGMNASLAAVRHTVQGLPQPTVFYVVWHDPPMTAGPGTFIDEIITAAGGRNLFHDAATPWPQVSLEVVVRRQPDVLVVPRGEKDLNLDWLQTASGWRELRAVREGHIVRVDADLFNRPGPRVAEAARKMAALLHPEAFPPRGRP